MSELYKNPLRVYLTLALLGLWGVLSALHLPISLFPNNSQPKIGASVPTADLSSEDFANQYGYRIESELKKLTTDGTKVEKLTASYGGSVATYEVEFEWGANGDEALRLVQTTLASLSSSWPKESRDGYSAYVWRQNRGFFAASFYSSKRSLDDLYELLNPLTLPIGSKVPDAEHVSLYNPQQKTIEIVPDFYALALRGIKVSAIENILSLHLNSLNAGQLKIGDKQLSIEMPRAIGSIEDIQNLPIKIEDNNHLLLKDIARVSLKVDSVSSQSFKTSGQPSLILFASPKPDGNIKKMSDDLRVALEELNKKLPTDIQNKILVNPSDFINSSVRSVAHEVGLAALLAVVVLFVFIGNFKNVATAAIEIPLSLIVAFILMKIFDMNINLISLGGLALSAGMNVDASVVVMENIFRKFDEYKGPLDEKSRLRLVVEAVNEVKWPILSATVASLVVFLPLVMTTGIAQSVLGDLAKAVIFSHGLSALIALVLVPTVRLQMMQSETQFHLKSPMERVFNRLEEKYIYYLEKFIHRKKWRWSAYGTIVFTLVALGVFVLPRLPFEIIGKPETDWVVVNAMNSTYKETRQMESLIEYLEHEILSEHADSVLYTFAQIHGPSYGDIMLRLKNKNEMQKLTKALEEKYTNTPTISYWVGTWNPSELRLPDPPDFKVEVRGGTKEERDIVAKDLVNMINESKIFSRASSSPSSSDNDQIQVHLHRDRLAINRQELSHFDLAQLVRIATQGRRFDSITIENKSYPIVFRGAADLISTLDELKSLPINVDKKIVPLGALAEIQSVPAEPQLYRINESEVSVIMARADSSEKHLVEQKKKEMQKAFSDWISTYSIKNLFVTSVTPDIEVREAVSELQWALLLSIVLIFFIMILQFGDLIHSLLVLAAIPTGLIGVLLSLYAFGSTLSLNSALGTILLNGIAVSNSIILVDFMRRFYQDGMSPEQAALAAARSRLRPILMTSLTTVLGMTPIALGFGEGGKILQPLGIAVAGGLWISTLMTIFLVPTLQASYLRTRLEREKKKEGRRYDQKVNWHFSSSLAQSESRPPDIQL